MHTFIKPSAAIRQNYSEIASLCKETGEPVFLTKNGRGTYAILTIKEYEKLSATVKLFSELSKGEESAKEKGWIDSKDVKEILGL